MRRSEPARRRDIRLRWITLALLAGLAGQPAAITYAYTGVFGWSTLAALPLVRTEAQGGPVNGKLYVLGGFYDTSYRATTRSDVYDPATNSWSRLADMPQAITHAASVRDGETIYLIGGYVGNNPGPSTSRVLIFNTRTNTWSEGPPLPEPRGAGAAAIVGRTIHFFGGALRTSGTNDADQTDHFMLDLDGGTGWTRGPALPLGRNHLGSVVLGGQIYVIGGQFGHNEGTTAQSRVDVFNPASKSWSRAADLPVGRSHIEASVLVVDGRILVLGGSTNDGAAGKASTDVYAYDPATDVWLRMAPLLGGRKSPVAGFINDRLLVAGGGTGSPTSTMWGATLPDRWETQAAMPLALGEVASGIIGNKLYVVGEGNNATLAYDLGATTWSSGLAQRPFPGNHHAAEVVGGRLYLFGGLGSSSSGKVQIFNPAANSWSLGADMPFAAGSSASAVIDGKVYVAGGIIGNTTTTQAAVYDPATNSWRALAPMPQGRNHAAATTDGRRLWVFGGRGPGSGDNNTVANGFDTVQVYDPATNTWQSSASGASLAPLPIGRGGMGKAVYAGGAFYIFGGETASGPGATVDKVYNRVDVYRPRTNTWSELATMPTARHGIFPLLIGGRVYVAGGGTKAGFSQSAALEVFNLPAGDPEATTPTSTPLPPSATPHMTTTPKSENTPIATPVPAEKAALVVGVETNAGDQALVARLQSLGFTVTVQTSANLTSADAAGKQVVLITASVTASQVGTKLRNVAVPLINLREELFDELGMTVANGGYATAQTKVTIVNAAHPLAAGLSGTPTVLTLANWISYGAPTGDAVVVATVPGNSAQATIFAYENGATMAGMAAPARRVGFFFRQNAPSYANAAGWSLFDAAIAWAAPDTLPPPTPTRTATPTDTNTPTATNTPTIAPTATRTPSPTATATATGTAPAGGVVVRLNAGGAATTLDGQSWAADQYFNGGKSYTNRQITEIGATTADGLYLTERSTRNNLATFSYAIPVPANGSYRVRLHFAETYWGAPGGGAGGAGKRVFSANLEGGPVELANYDIFADVGPMVAVVKEYTVTVSDGQLNIAFSAATYKATVNAIEVLAAAAPAVVMPPTSSPTTTTTRTHTPTATETPTPSATPTQEPTSTPSVTRTHTPTATETGTPTATPADEPTSTPTVTPTDEPTSTPTTTPADEPGAEPGPSAGGRSSGWLYTIRTARG